MIGNIIDDKEVQDKVGYEKYDIVVANILADVLVPLTPVILHQLKTGGILYHKWNYRCKRRDSRGGSERSRT